MRYSMVAKWAESRGLAFTTYTNLSARPEVYELIAGEVEKVNASLPPAQRITRFLLLYKELDADDGELTRTRKVRRGVIDQRYQQADRGALFGPGARSGRDRGDLRGRPHRHDQGRDGDPRRGAGGVPVQQAAE